MLDWSITNYGGEIRIDDYNQMPTDSVAVVDVETTGDDDGNTLVCVGISTGDSCWVYFDIRPQLVDYLQRLQIIGHDLKRAEIPWLSKYGVTIENAYVDTKTMLYAYDSSRKQLGLKAAIKDIFGVEYPGYDAVTTNREFIIEAVNENRELLQTEKLVKKTGLPKSLTLDKMPKKIVAEYNSADTFWTYRLWTWLRQNMTPTQTAYFETIEMPMTRLIYKMERRGVQIDTQVVRRIHNEQSRARRKARKELFERAGAVFNPNSPKQVLPLLRAAGANVDSTDEDTIKRYGHLPFVSSLLTYREHQKVCSTYTIPLYTHATQSADGRIHARFSQNTITGRLSSSDPNPL